MRSHHEQSRHIPPDLHLYISVWELILNIPYLITKPLLYPNWNMLIFYSHLVYNLEKIIFKNNFIIWLIKLIVLHSLQYLLFAFLGIATNFDWSPSFTSELLRSYMDHWACLVVAECNLCLLYLFSKPLCVFYLVRYSSIINSLYGAYKFRRLSYIYSVICGNFLWDTSIICQ